MSTGSAHDVYETRSRLSGAAASDEFARWRELPPRPHPVEPTPLPPDVWRLLHRLRLRYIREAGPAVLARAHDEGWDFTDVLKVLLAEEAAGRDRSTRRMHRKAARLPSGETFDAWDPKASAIPGDAQWALRSLDWIGRAKNLGLVGPSGTGKSHFAEAIAHAAIDRDLRVSWFTLESLTATIARSRIDASTGKVVERIVRSELVVVDIGLLPAGADEAEALYRLVDAAYEKRSLILTSNLHPARFDTIFPKGLATAAVDRLLHHAHVIITEGRSHRLTEAVEGRGVAPAAGHRWHRAVRTACWSQQSEPRLNERCTVVVMGRIAVRALLGAGLLVGSLAMASELRAAGEVVLALSPSEVEVGEPVEVLLRTFVPIARQGTLPQSSVREPYPAPSGFWNVLMPWDDYPFDVVAQHDGDADVAVSLARDPSDLTLWRGNVSLPSPGTWTIWVRNFPGKEPGSTTTVTVRGGSAPTASPPPNATTTGQASIEAGPVALIAAVIGLVVGVLAARAWRRRPAS